MSDRLRQARKDAGYTSAQNAIDTYGWKAAAYRHHENGTREFDIESAKRYGRAFKVNPGWLLALDSIRPAVSSALDEEIEVVGKVAAGIWREQAQFGPEERFKIKVGPSPVGGAERFAVLAEGRSMDKLIPDGSILECVRVIAGVAPKDGDLVIVQRQDHDLTEMTCKRLIIKDGEWALHAESSLPEFAKDIHIGKPDPDYHFNDNTVHVIGIVVRSYQSHFRR